MKRREDGSMAAAFMIGFAVIGAATVSVQNTTAKLSSMTKEVKVEREMEKSREGALSALGRFKGMMSPKKLSSGPNAGQYMPALFSQNYFSLENRVLGAGEQVSSPADKINWNFTSSTNTALNIKVQSSLDTEMVSAERVFTDPNLHASSLVDEDFQVRVLKWNIDMSYTSAGQGYLVKSVDVEVKSLSTTKPVVLSARIDYLEPPEPYGSTLRYRKAGSSDPWQVLSSGAQLPAAAYSFQIFGSGVVKEAFLKTKYSSYPSVGLDNYGNPTHEAVNYLAKDKLIGQYEAVSLQNSTDFDQVGCNAIEQDGKAQLQAVLIGADGENYPGTIVDVTITSPLAVLTENDYETVCSAECPWLGGAHEWDSTVFTDRYTGTPLGDMSGRWTYSKAQRYNILNKKVCVNLDGLDESNARYFVGAAFFLYTPVSCNRQFLTQRNACGCVAQDTQILLGDGKTQKRIDQIVNTDLIWNPLLNKAFAIRKMTQGPEKIPMLKLQVAGKTLSVTGNHPFPTRSGMRTAFTLIEGEEIMIEGEGWKPINKIDVVVVAKGATAPIVWNIEVEAPADDFEAHHYVANGVVTGDLFIQTKLQNAQLNAKNE